MSLKADYALQRKNLIGSFLESENITFKSLIKIKSDASHRKYYRIQNKKLLLMDADPRTNEKLTSFVKIDKILLNYGLTAPKIYKKDILNGLMLLEDFGEDTFSKILNKKNEKIMYKNALEVLSVLNNKGKTAPTIKGLKKYTINEQLKETSLFFEWYLQEHLGKKLDKDSIFSFELNLKKLYKKICTKNRTLVLRDFHVDNLIRRADKKIGLIDFQDALLGSSSYDLSSIVEDVRRPISRELKDMLIKYFHKLTKEDLEKLKIEIAYFSIQRNMKIIGIFSRLKYRDNKPRYMKYIPNAKDFIRNHLEKQELRILKDWFEANRINV